MYGPLNVKVHQTLAQSPQPTVAGTHSITHSIRVTPIYNFQERHLRCCSVFKNTTFCCIKYLSKLYLRDDDDYMFRLSFLSHLHFVTVGYFNIQLTLILSTRYRLHKLDIY